MTTTSVTSAFAHFPDRSSSYHSTELQPVFDSLPADEQTWMAEIVRRFDPRNSDHYAPLAAALGVSESAAVGLMVLLHPDA